MSTIEQKARLLRERVIKSDLPFYYRLQQLKKIDRIKYELLEEKWNKEDE